MREERQSTIDAIIFISLGALTLLPLNTIGNAIRILVIVFAFFIKPKMWDMEKKMAVLLISMIVSPLLPIIAVLLIEGISLSFRLVLHEVLRILFAVATIYVASTLKIKFKYVYFLITAVLLLNLFVQILQYQRLEAVYNFIKTTYVMVEDGFTHLDLMFYEGSGFRAGSIFLNPNIYMVVPITATVIYFQKKRTNDTLFNNILIICAAISCLLTGSRTAIIVIAVILFLFYNSYNEKRYLRWVVIAAVVIGLWYLNRQDEVDNRALALQIDQMDSLWVKLKGFVWYWQTSNPIYWLTGSLGSPSVSGIDSEIGHIYSWFGVFGIWWYIQYYKLIYSRNSSARFYSGILIIAMILSSITAGVMLSMQVFPLMCAFCFSDITAWNEKQPEAVFRRARADTL